jgi:hypothetical protein
MRSTSRRERPDTYEADRTPLAVVAVTNPTRLVEPSDVATIPVLEVNTSDTPLAVLVTVGAKVPVALNELLANSPHATVVANMFVNDTPLIVSVTGTPALSCVLHGRLPPVGPAAETVHPDRLVAQGTAKVSDVMEARPSVSTVPVYDTPQVMCTPKIAPSVSVPLPVIVVGPVTGVPLTFHTAAEAIDGAVSAAATTTAASNDRMLFLDMLRCLLSAPGSYRAWIDTAPRRSRLHAMPLIVQLC